MNNTEAIPLSALNHWAYCPRRCGLIHMEGEFTDNIHTACGNSEHAQVDRAAHVTSRDGARVEYALPVWSDRQGLIGKCDVVEFWPDGSVFPVEYKHGPKRKWLNDDIQLAAQAMCLEDMLGCAARRDLSCQQPSPARCRHHAGFAREGHRNRRCHPRHAGIGQAAAAGE